MKRVSVNRIRVDGGAQSRATTDGLVVAEYAEAIEKGDAFPPVTVFFDGRDYWLADGFHRHAAYLKASKTKIPIVSKRGTKRDAILFSVGANATHGLRRTNEDKRRAVKLLLDDAEWVQWSDREIAKRCGVHHQLVAKLRQLDESSRSETRIGADGKSRRLPVQSVDPEPTPSMSSDALTDEHPRTRAMRERDEEVRRMTLDGLPSSEIAKALGVSVSTIQDAKARLKLVQRETNPLARLTSELETQADMLETIANNFKPEWDAANEEQRKEAIHQASRLRGEARKLMKRLNKEAAKED